MLASRVRSVLKAYDNFVIKSPLIGTAITSGVGMGAGNLICQSIMYLKHDKPLNIHSFLQYAAFGLLISVDINQNLLGLFNKDFNFELLKRDLHFVIGGMHLILKYSKIQTHF